MPQLIPRSHEDRESHYRDEHRIFLAVRVTDPSGKPSASLAQGDFTLLDNHEPRAIASFRSVPEDDANAPTHAILVIDALNNSTRDLSFMRRDIEKLLKQSDGPLPLPTSIAVATETGMTAGASTLDRETLRNELQTMAGDIHADDCMNIAADQSSELRPLVPDEAPVGKSMRVLDCMNHRFINSVVALKIIAEQQTNVRGRAIVIWIGHGWPLLSDHQFMPETPEIRKNFFGNLIEISTMLREAQITLDEVSTSSDYEAYKVSKAQWQAPEKDIPREEEMTARGLSLQELAKQSGGEIIHQGNDIVAGINLSLRLGESYYVLSFDSPPGPSSGEFHSLEVTVNKEGLTAHTNTLYYDEP